MYRKFRFNKGTGNVHPRTGHEDPEEQYSFFNLGNNWRRVVIDRHQTLYTPEMNRYP
jgi:hypothetical protein